MRRVTFNRVYRMYQPGETAGFSDDEAARLIPHFGFDPDDPDAEARAAEKAAREGRSHCRSKGGGRSQGERRG